MEKKRSRGGSVAIIAGVSHKVRVGLGYRIFAVIEYKNSSFLFKDNKV